MQDRLEKIRLELVGKGYRCRTVKDFGFVAIKSFSTCFNVWRIWINYDGELVWQNKKYYKT